MIIIPDIHGREFWRGPVKNALNTGEYVVFLGDYLDPYEDEYIYPREAYEVFVDIMELKVAHPLDITLLLGNHDLHYVEYLLAGGRKDYIRAKKIKEKLDNNADLFDMAMAMKAGGKSFLFTHAGIKWGWIKFNKDLFDGVGADDIADYLNALWHVKNRRPQLLKALAQVSVSRWGRYAYGSPVWNDIDDMGDDIEELPGWYQVFGHSQQEKEPVIGRHFACLDCRKAFRLNEETGKIEVL